jgi:hypothetical protein
MRRYHISLSPFWRAPLLVIGVTTRSAFVELDGGTLRVKFGVFGEVYDLSEISSVEPFAWPWYKGIGLRYDTAGTLGFIGSQRGVVKIELTGKRTFRGVGVPLTGDAVAISLYDADNFVDDLRLGLGASVAPG